MKINGNPDGGGGGAAVWGGITGNINSQTDLNQQFVKKTGLKTVNEQSLVGSGDIEVGTLNPEDLKTINSQSIVGTGDIEVGGLTPEQEAAVEVLTDASKGMLYTNTINQYEAIYIPLEYANNSEYAGKLYDVDGETYFLYAMYLYKFNPDSLSFDKLGDFTISSGTTEAPMWKDMTGRMYKGAEYALDLDAMTYTPISLNASSYSYYNNDHTIWKGQYAVYNLGTDPQKFDETTQKFVSCTVNITEGYDVSSVAPNMSEYGVWYDGHYVWIDYSGNMFELTEYEDHLDISVVSTPYFPMTINSSYINCGYIRNVEGELYYLKEYDEYHLVNGSWEAMTNNFYFNYITGRGTVYENYLIGCEGFNTIGYTSIINMTTSETKTYWTEPNQVAVDLNSTQYINGSKHFGGIYTDIIYFQQLVGNSSPTSISLNKNETTASSIKLSVEGKFTMNNKNIATTDECIVNRTIIPYGDIVVDVIQNEKDPFKYNHFTTNTGRLFYTNDGGYEFDGTQWNSVSTPLTDDSTGVYGTNVVKAGSKTFYVNGNTYLWNDTNSQFVTIVTGAPASGWYIWPCGDGELRASGDYKLVENNGTWSWEQDTVSDYKYGMTYYINGNVYILSNNDGKVYQYDESTKTYTELGNYHSWTDSSFECAGEIFYPLNGDSIHKIDLSKVGVEQYIDVPTTIPYADFSNFYGEYNNYLYFYREYSIFSYCYDVEESVPAVPATNGTYTLKATVLDGQVTYSWVADV